MREPQQARARSVECLLGHRTGRGSRARPRLPGVGRELSTGEATGQLVVDIGVEQVGRQRGFGRSHGADIQRENIAPQGTLLAVAVDLLMRVLSAHTAAGSAGFGGSGVAAQAVAAHRAAHGHAAAHSYLGRAEQGHAAGTRAVHTTGRAFQHLQSPNNGGVEQIERRAAAGFGEGDTVVIHLHVAHSERRAQCAAPNAKAVAGRSSLLQPHAGQRVHGLGERGGAKLFNHTGIEHAHGGGGTT